MSNSGSDRGAGRPAGLTTRAFVVLGGRLFRRRRLRFLCLALLRLFDRRPEALGTLDVHLGAREPVLGQPRVANFADLPPVAFLAAALGGAGAGHLPRLRGLHSLHAERQTAPLGVDLEDLDANIVARL